MLIFYQENKPREQVGSPMVSDTPAYDGAESDWPITQKFKKLYLYLQYILNKQSLTK